MGNAVVHFEIGGPDDKPLIAFYSELFGWELQPSAGGYTMIDTRGGSGINGGIGKSQTGEPWSTFYVEAADLRATLDQAGSLGATTALPVTDFGVVTIAMFNDPDGLLVGLVQAPPEAGRDDEPAPSAGDGEPVDWFEVLGSSAQRTHHFYAELFGWAVDDAGSAGYAMVNTGTRRGIQGGLGAGGAEQWATTYASVGDVEQTLAKAEKLGGSRVYGPHQVDDHMQTGALRDPAGNVFGVYHHGPHAAP